MNKPRKIFIVKTGFSEFLDRGISITVSLGDVLMCTAILHIYKKDHVTWITSWEARRLLENNPFIDELLVFGPEAFDKINKKSFDILINLEKDIGICTYLSRVNASKRRGFYFNEQTHGISTYPRSARYLLAGQEHHRGINKNVYQILFETLGMTWNKEGAILERKSKKKQKFDVGFNHSVGAKWPTKAWPMQNWKTLEALLKDQYSVGWQQGFSNLEKYIDWIDSCRLIVTSDSLGQVLGQALGKKVITLFGSTNYRRMDRIPNISIVKSSLQCPYRPCYLMTCRYHKYCMDYISPVNVAEKCRKLLAK